MKYMWRMWIQEDNKAVRSFATRPPLHHDDFEEDMPH